MRENEPTGTLDRALALIRFLRANCEWDAAQTPRSLIPYLLEESHETAEAILREDEHALAHELGDLLLNLAFQVVLAEERAAFTAEDVVRHMESKMRRRHPHLYGEGPARPWEELKARERADRPSASALEGLATGLDALSRAQRIQDRVAAIGFDWSEPGGALDKVREEVDELAAHIGMGSPQDVEEELGDLLFAVVNVARLTGGHALLALQRANAKFERRFRALEALARARGIDLNDASLPAMDALWEDVKRTERAGPPQGTAPDGHG